MFGSRALAIVAVSLVAVVGGALLAWWQWTRYTSATGTLQNLGYVLQWPLFGVFPAFMFWRINRTAQRERAADEADANQADTAADTNAEPVPMPRQETPRQKPPRQGTPRQKPEPQLDPRLTYTQNRTVAGPDQELDQELLAYNNYLARLADREQHSAWPQPPRPNAG
jgi:DNA-binding transcriptional regulator of glucitol operon